jgi:UDP-N-acetylglucosamine 1-carboxyvinyltransferase
MHLVNGSSKVSGQVDISGAKNSLLPLICASILGDESSLSNAPNIRDADILLKILSRHGVAYEISENEIKIYSSDINQGSKIEVYGDDVSKIRYSTILMGALIGKGYKNIAISYPGGCSSFGTRPIDIHLAGFEAFGVKVSLSDNHLTLNINELKKRVSHKLRFPSVGATINLILAAAAVDECILENIAIEPEILDLMEFLEKLGFKFEFLSERVLKIDTKSYNKNRSIIHRVIPDRIETISYVVLGALCSEKQLTIKNANIEHTLQPLHFLRKMGIETYVEGDTIIVDRAKELCSSSLHVGVYPEIGTDYQPLIAAAMIFAEGESEIIDPIYPKRFAYLDELSKLGVVSNHFDGIAKISGNRELKTQLDIEVTCHDLRAGFTLLIFGLLNSGTMILKNSEQISRGYFSFVDKLNAIGTNVIEVENE